MCDDTKALFATISLHEVTMSRNLFVSLSCFFFALLCAGCDSGPRIAPFSQDAVVLAFGDSLTYGTGAPAGQSYTEVLANLIDRPVVNVGVPGEVSAAGLTRLPAMLERYKPSLVILCHGGNDFLHRLDQEETNRNLIAMVELIRSQGADVILVGVPRLGFGLEVPTIYSRIAEQYMIPLQRDILLNLLSDKDMKSDAIHPNATGYRLMAEAIYEVIKKAQRN
jgi:lysophospholipase L1-like esterase